MGNRIHKVVAGAAPSRMPTPGHYLKIGTARNRRDLETARQLWGLRLR